MHYSYSRMCYLYALHSVQYNVLNSCQQIKLSKNFAPFIAIMVDNIWRERHAFNEVDIGHKKWSVSISHKITTRYVITIQSTVSNTTVHKHMSIDIAFRWFNNGIIISICGIIPCSLMISAILYHAIVINVENTVWIVSSLAEVYI